MFKFHRSVYYFQFWMSIFWLLVAGVAQAQTVTNDPNKSLVTTNPDLPDPLAGGGDPEETGITPEQFIHCNVCSPTFYQPVAACPAVIGTQIECGSYCHVPDTFTERANLDPPVSGNHYPIPENRMGEHTVPVKRGKYVHSMEHGIVVFVYNCPNGCDTELKVLRSVLAARPGARIILTPDPLMKGPTRFAALSWTWAYRFDQPDVSKLTCFVDQHQFFGRECEPGPNNTRICPAVSDKPMPIR
jgi:hypothetical protein